MKKTLILVLLVLFSTGVTTYAQFSKGDSYFGIYGAFVPSKVDYAKNLGFDAGYLKLGYAFGVEKTRAIGSSGLGWVTSLSIVLQSYNQSKIENIFTEGTDIDLDTFDIKFKSILNFPLMTGLKFQKNLVDKLELYGQAQIGLNINKMGSWEIEGEEISFDPKPTLGFTIGGGFIINERFNVGIRYYMLGEPEVEGKAYYEDGSKDNIPLDKVKINMLSFVLGVNF